MEGCLSSAGDVYSFGCLAWEMVMGIPPFEGLGMAQVLYHSLHGHRHSLEKCPPGLSDLINTCWQQEASARCVAFVAHTHVLAKNDLVVGRPTFKVLLERIAGLLQEANVHSTV